MSQGHTGFIDTSNGQASASLLRVFPYLCGV